MDEKVYGVIAEFKAESPIIMEGRPMTHQEAYGRMKKMESDHRVIRVAMFRAVYESGHDGLIPKS